MKVKISEFRIDPEISIRQELNEKTLRDYMEDFEVLPPVVIFDTERGKVLADGFHRVTAAERLGLLEIEAEIRKGSYREALEYAVIANSKHGLRLSSEEKKAGIRRLHRLHSEWGTEKIAKVIGCSQPHVWKVLRADEVRKEIPGTSLHDEKLIEISRADKEYWEPLASVAERKGYTTEEVKDIVREIKAPSTPLERKDALLKGEALPITKKGEELALRKETIEREIAEKITKDKEVAFTGVLLALSKLEVFKPKEVVDALEEYLCERAVKDLPRFIDHLKEVLRLAREKLEIREVLDE